MVFELSVGQGLEKHHVAAMQIEAVSHGDYCRRGVVSAQVRDLPISVLDSEHLGQTLNTKSCLSD